MEKIKIGKIVNAVGLKGEVKVYNYSDYKERFEELDEIFAGTPNTETKYDIESVRYQKEAVILKLRGVNDRNAAEEMKDKDVFITEDDLRELPDDTFYIRDLIGLDVVDVDTKRVVGRLKDVLQNSGQDIYVVETMGEAISKKSRGKEALIPAVKEFVKEINPSKGYIAIKPIPGLLDLNDAISDAENANENPSTDAGEAIK